VAVDSKDNVIYVNHRFEELHPDYSEKTKKIIYKKIKDEFEANRDLSIDENFYHIIAKELLQDGEKQGTIFVMHDVTEAHRHMELINSYNEQLEKEVVNKTVHIREIQDKMILGMADMVENRDFSTGGHIKRTSDVIKCLVDEMRKDNTLNLSDKFYECLIKAAPMHDLGKIAVDDDILRKPGRFTEEEYDEMKTHAEKGARIVRQLLEGVEDPYFAQIAENVAHYHHERFDGNGYPEGLKGDKIPLEARIMTIADVYDALVSKRCYKESMPYDKAAAIIEEGMGSQFDKSLFAYFQGCRAKLEAYYEGIKES